MIVASDGYILAVLGPHMADGSNNDANILMHEMNKDISDLKSWLQEDDVMIVDRGYRDCIQFLNDLGIITHMPHFMKKGQKQHSTEEANESRLVTKLRWIVEKMNGDVKQVWKFLNGTIPTAHLINVGDFFRIGCALLNAFYPRVQIQDNPVWMSQQLIERGRGPNLVQQRVEREKLLGRMKKFTELTSEQLRDFPALSENDLREITLGTYQLKQAAHYVAEKQLRDGQFDWKLYTIDDTENNSSDPEGNPNIGPVGNENGQRLIRAKVWSRHSKAKSYKVFVQYDETKVGSAAISGWYCLCPAGARTVGCCAHVSAILWWCGHEHEVGSVAPLAVPSSKVLAQIEDAADRNVVFPTLLAEPLNRETLALPEQQNVSALHDSSSSTASSGNENGSDNDDGNGI